MLKRYIIALFLLIGACTPIESDDWVVENVCKEQENRPKWTWNEYREILDELNKPQYVVVPMNEFEEAISQNTDKIVVTLRHDIDGNPCAAKTMAQIEQGYGIRSAYYVNHNEKYYYWIDEDGKRRRRDDTMYRWRELQSLGHEVGLHYDILTMYFDNGEEPIETLYYELWYLASQGIAVYGGVAHGSGTTIKLGISNYRAFKEFAGPLDGLLVQYSGESFVLGSMRYSDFMLYEANFMNGETMYLSDSGGTWSGKNPIDILPTLKPGDAVQILTHPVWWGKK